MVVAWIGVWELGLVKLAESRKLRVAQRRSRSAKSPTSQLYARSLQTTENSKQIYFNDAFQTGIIGRAGIHVVFLPVYYARPNRVLVHVVHFLFHECRCEDLFRMVAVRPNLVFFIALVTAGKVLELVQHPKPSAFSIRFGQQQHLPAGEFLAIPDHITQVAVSGRYDRVGMVAHDYTCINPQSFVGAAEPQAFGEYLPVFPAAENIYPAYHRESDKMYRRLIPDLIAFVEKHGGF